MAWPAAGGTAGGRRGGGRAPGHSVTRQAMCLSCVTCHHARGGGLAPCGVYAAHTRGAHMIKQPCKTQLEASGWLKGTMLAAASGRGPEQQMLTPWKSKGTSRRAAMWREERREGPGAHRSHRRASCVKLSSTPSRCQPCSRRPGKQRRLPVFVRPPLSTPRGLQPPRRVDLVPKHTILMAARPLAR